MITVDSQDTVVTFPREQIFGTYHLIYNEQRTTNLTIYYDEHKKPSLTPKAWLNMVYHRKDVTNDKNMFLFRSQKGVWVVSHET